LLPEVTAIIFASGYDTESCVTAVADIDDLAMDFETTGAEIGDALFNATGNSVEHLDPRAFGGEALNDRTPNSTRAARHDRHTTFEAPAGSGIGWRTHV